MKEFAGKTVLVTGGSRGQGAFEARLFAGSGASVVVCDVLDEQGRAVVDAIQSEGGKAEYCHLDVASSEQWRDAIAAVARAYGGLHVLVNNAGIPLGGVGMMTTPSGTGSASWTSTSPASSSAYRRPHR